MSGMSLQMRDMVARECSKNDMTALGQKTETCACQTLRQPILHLAGLGALQNLAKRKVVSRFEKTYQRCYESKSKRYDIAV